MSQILDAMFIGGLGLMAYAVGGVFSAGLVMATTALALGIFASTQ